MSAQPEIHLGELHEGHVGLTHNLWGSYCEAACVCLDKHHTTPRSLDVDVDGDEQTCVLHWGPATPTMQRAHGNRIDATEFGAYAISFACLERIMSLFCVARTDHATGADWYVAPLGHGLDEYGIIDKDSPELLALEVSGTDKEAVEPRVLEKVEQLRRGSTCARGLAVVVGFEQAQVKIAQVDLEG